MNAVLHASALKRIKAIHELSRRVNTHAGISHEKKLLKLVRKHIDEIEELQRDNNPHFIVETGDLLILCLELLLERNVSIDETTLKCFKRYEQKLSQLLNEKT